MNTYTLTFTEDQLAVLNDALVELPFKKSAPVIQAVNIQLRAIEQEAAAKEEPKA